MRSEDNELLTRVGPGTPMGELMRLYWIPALKPEELVAGGAPVRIRLLGENFLAFRSPEGKIGVVDHQCAHRCASLFYGRNEVGGIRCVYHGWKFARDGQCVEMPSEPAETDYKDRVKIKALHVAERHGVVWVHMGDRNKTPPPLPHFDWDELSEGVPLSVSFMMRECNWLQALEGDIDTCHVGFLHLGLASSEDFEEGSINYYRQLPENLAPKYEAMETNYGNIYCAYRHAGPDKLYHRIGQFAMPFWTMAPSEPMDHIRARAWVPLDDHHSMLVVIGGPRTATTLTRDGNPIAGTTDPIKFLPNTTDWLGRYRIEENPRNDHLISRDAQRDASYTGIQGIPVQDQAVTESMGPIVDRTKEHLGTSDRMIMLTRRKLMRSAIALRDQGIVPTDAEQPEAYHFVRAGFAVLPKEHDWLDYYNERRREWSRGTAAPIERMQRGLSQPKPEQASQ